MYIKTIKTFYALTDPHIGYQALVPVLTPPAYGGSECVGESMDHVIDEVHGDL